jgi:hypothetical protein
MTILALVTLVAAGYLVLMQRYGAPPGHRRPGGGLPAKC